MSRSSPQHWLRQTAEFALGLLFVAGGALYIWTGIIEWNLASPPKSVDAPRPLTHAARLRGSGELWAAAGKQQLDRALATGSTSDSSERYLRQAVESLSAGLVLSPLDPYAWANLALALWLTGAPGPEAAHALERSLASGPAERNLLELRLRLINALTPYLSGEGRRVAAHELDLARRYRPDLQRLIDPPA